MSELASFSEWTLALLPRLFLYPGGLWLGALIVGLRFSSAGKQSISPNTLLLAFSRADLTSMATAWAAVALLPLPGANSLTFPTDRFVLAGLLAISLAFDSLREVRLKRKVARGAENAEDFGIGDYELRIELAIFIALLAPIAGQRTLLEANIGLSGWLSLFAVFLGVTALSLQAASNLGLAARLIGWLGLTSSPLWTLLWLENPIRVALVYMILILTAAILGRLAANRIKADWSMGVVWSLAALSLLAALLLPA